MPTRPLPVWLPRVDYFVNVILLTLGTLGSFLLFGLFLFIPLGLWQVVIGLVRVYRYRQRAYQFYLLLTALWFAVAGLYAAFGLFNNGALAILLGICAYLLAGYACYLANRSYKAARTGQDVIPPELIDHML